MPFGPETWIILVLAVAIAGGLGFALGGRGNPKHGIARIISEMEILSREGNLERRLRGFGTRGELARLAAAINKSFDKIEALLGGMEGMLGDIAHDMRTPVSRIRGLAESMLSEPDITPREEELAGKTIEECDRILGLINTILEINAAEARLIDLAREDLDLVPLIREGVDLFTSLIEDHRHSIEVTLPDEAPVRGSHTFVQRVISNLLDNAVKYTPDGGRLSITLTRVRDTHILEIADTGIGIAPEESELIFRRFYRSDKSRTLPGNGLGLTFCRAVVTSMGGRIYHRAREVAGSDFVIELPVSNRTGPPEPRHRQPVQ